MAAIPKETSYPYGEAYQSGQVEKYLDRARNHWQHRIDLAHRLLEEYALPRFAKPRGEIVGVDVGCSIGTFAIELAKLGLQSYGVDFDPKAIDAATALSAQEGVAPTFACMDVSDWKANFPEIDIAVCMDIFEHLHDDELGALLVGIRRQLSPRGCMVFHTYPTDTDHLFYSQFSVVLPLAAFAWLPVPAFQRLTKAYAAAVDAALALGTGQTWRERMALDGHCNPLSKDRLANIFRRTGWKLVMIDTAQLFPMEARRARWFAKHPISHPNLFGVVEPR